MNYFLRHTDFLYTRIMLFSWECESDLTSFSQTNGEFFVTQLEKILHLSDVKLVVVNCNNVMDIDDHFLDPITKFITKKNICLIFYSNDGINKLPKYCNEHLSNRPLVGSNNSFLMENNHSIYYFNNKKEKNIFSGNRLIEETGKLEKSTINKIIANCYSEKEQELSSTPLIASGVFNAMKLLSDPSIFRWLTLLMVDNISRVILEKKISKCTILASSLRGASIAGSIREIINYLVPSELYLFDHIGPKHNVILTPNQINSSLQNTCIYIGDFMIAGTEVKITQAYCNLFSSRIEYAFVLGKYTKKNIVCRNVEVKSLVQLSECVDKLEYKLV